MKMITFISTLLLSAGMLFAENYQYPSQPTPQDNSTIQEMAEVTIKTANDPKLGKILTDSKGKTLYMFTPDKNKSNTSTCYGECAATWPPLLISSGKPVLAPGIIGTLDTTNRSDHTVQVTYNGMPLYYYAKDKKAGDTYGQNIENKWFVINPK
jgi:predicted lipoprotein with Yx(FWY)xxD motif